MKTFKLQKKVNYFACLLLLFLLSSCILFEKSEYKFDKEYVGCVVFGKTMTAWPEYFLVVRMKDSTYREIKVTPALYESFSKGDTIK